MKLPLLSQELSDSQRIHPPCLNFYRFQCCLQVLKQPVSIWIKNWKLKTKTYLSGWTNTKTKLWRSFWIKKRALNQVWKSAPSLTLTTRMRAVRWLPELNSSSLRESTHATLQLRSPALRTSQTSLRSSPCKIWLRWARREQQSCPRSLWWTRMPSVSSKTSSNAWQMLLDLATSASTRTCWGNSASISKPSSRNSC